MTLAEAASFEMERKRSRFLARAVPVASPQEAMEKVGALSDPDASHNCWAYRVGDQYRFSDDGEPGGTAGRPILSAIEAQGVDRVLVLVSRQFGGIKLGAGGLARAYGGAAASCLRGANKLEIWPTVRLRVSVSFADLGAVKTLLAHHAEVTALGDEYGPDGASFILRIPRPHRDLFASGLCDATRGRARVEELGE